MIINTDREPTLSLYYVGGIILEILAKNNHIEVDELIKLVQDKYSKKIHVDFIYYTLDWLFLLSNIKMEGGKLYYENQGTYST